LFSLFPQPVAACQKRFLCSRNLWRLVKSVFFVPTGCGGSAKAFSLFPQIVAARQTAPLTSHNLWQLGSHSRLQSY